MEVKGSAIDEGMRFFLSGRTVRRMTVERARTFMSYRVLDYVTDGGKHGELSVRLDRALEATR